MHPCFIHQNFPTYAWQEQADYASKIPTRPYRPPSRHGLQFVVHRLREKSMWFVNNIVTTHPNVHVRMKPKRPSRTRKPSRYFAREKVVQNSEQEQLRSEPSHSETTFDSQDGASPKRLRSSKRKCGDCGPKGGSDSDSDAEDLGQMTFAEPSALSGLTHYYTASSHFSGFYESGTFRSLPVISEDPASENMNVQQENSVHQLIKGNSESPPDAASHIHTADPSRSPCIQFCQPSGAPQALTPSIVLTLPTPRLSQSPIFQPRSPITLAKYLQATSPLLNSVSPSVSTGSLSPVPSVPSCDRCCLGQLENGLICRACERQWLACKMWYQANDGGQRRWLKEPFIRPAESNANLREVMGVLGVSGHAGDVGLGIEQPSIPSKKTLPFKVIPRPADTSRLSSSDKCSDHGRRWRRLSTNLVDIATKTRKRIQTWFSVPLSSAVQIRQPLSGLHCGSPPTSLGSMWWLANVTPDRPPSISTAAQPYGLPLCALGRCVSSSRYFEHLV